MKSETIIVSTPFRKFSINVAQAHKPPHTKVHPLQISSL